ncbi:MAG: MFS transporter [Clostridia bacterium]|nr:MFS transporter [Clostridia bacterium]MBQ4338700.1 MFS transporter [Clostridia bacterium]
MESEVKTGVFAKAKNAIRNVKEYWNVPAKGNYIPYKEVVAISGAGFGVNWAMLLANQIGLSAGNFLVGASIGLRPMDLQIMLTVANLIGIPIGIFRSWYYDNHHIPGGKFLPFIRKTGFPIVLISMIFVWLPYEYFNYTTKAVVVWLMYFLLSQFLCFYNESYTYFQQIISPNAQERANVMSISQVIYSLAPTISNLFIPMIAGWTWGLDNIWTYRVIYPVFTIIGFIITAIFFRRVKERLILPKKKLEPVRMLDAIREVAKNKYYWIIHSAAWVVFLESGYGIILNWSFVYAHNGQYDSYLGLANTVIGNAALWSMLLAPLAIKVMGKRNLLITSNTINIVVLVILYFTYRNLILICVLWYFNTFISTFWNIVQHQISADMRDYHQWKTGVRVDGLFGPLGMIGTVIGFFTGMVYPAIYEKMGLLEDYSVLYDDTIRNNLFEVLIICSAVGAFLNLIPFCFYDLTENKHKAYVGVLKIRAMFENYSLGVLEDGELEEAMEIIREANNNFGKEKVKADKTASKAEKKAIKETNLAIERAAIIMQDLNKFSGEAGIARLTQAKADYANGNLYFYENAREEMRLARSLPKSTQAEKEIRSDAIKNARTKKEAASLIKKYGIDNIVAPDESVKEELQNRETNSFAESIKVRKELRAYLKAVSIYERAVKPYTDAKNLIEQAENYTHYEEIEARYAAISAE